MPQSKGEKSKADVEVNGPWREFVKETTAHGIRNAASQSSCPERRLLWFIAFLAACVTMAYQLTVLGIDYYSYPFKTVSRIVPKTSNVFPSVTICDLNRFDSNLVNYSKDLQTIYRVHEKSFWASYSNVTMEHLRETEPYSSLLKRRFGALVQEASPTINNTFVWCNFDGVVRDCSEYVDYIHTQDGRCFVFNNDQSNPRSSSRPGERGGFLALMRTDPSGYTYSDNNAMGFKVVLHSIENDPDVTASGLYISPGFINEISFQEQRYAFLPEPYKAYGNESCVSDFQEEGVTRKIMAPSTCMKIKATDYAKSKCNCNWSNCNLDSFLTCFSPNFNDFYERASRSNRAGCRLACKTVSYPTTISKALYPSPDTRDKLAFYDNGVNSSKVVYLMLNVFFDDFMVREDRHIAEYDMLSILGTIGGNVGLFLGASVLTVGEILELIILSLIGVFKKFVGRA